MNLTDFLLARIAEDYDEAVRLAGSSFLAEQVRSGRALAECEAKRRIAALHPVSKDGHCCVDPLDINLGEAMYWDEPCETLRILALPHSDHPDYREEWRP